VPLSASPTSATDGLSPAQLMMLSRLDAEGAFPSALANGSVFLYRTTGTGTDRWLVTRAGQVVDFTHLSAAAA
jgi:hypothetical protein